MAEEKSFKPSKRKIEKARREGKALKSQLVTQAAVLLAFFAVLWCLGGSIWVAPKMLLEYGVATAGNHSINAGLYAVVFVFQAVTLVLGVCAAVALALEFAQVGVRVESKPLGLQFARLSPANGLIRMGTGIKQVWEPLLRVISVAAVGGILLVVALPRFAALQSAQSGVLLREAATLMLSILGGTAGVVVAAAGMDYLLRRRVFYRELSMSHDEVREETKEMEGSPLMRALRRMLHERIAMQDLEQRVRRSKVIVVRKASR